MQKPSPQFVVYLLGVAVLGFFYETIKGALGSQWLFVVGVACYLFALRFIGAWVTSVWTQRKVKS